MRDTTPSAGIGFTHITPRVADDRPGELRRSRTTRVTRSRSRWPWRTRSGD